MNIRQKEPLCTYDVQKETAFSKYKSSLTRFASGILGFRTQERY